MKIVLPKPSRGYVYPRLFPVEMNDFDVERLLPSLFYLVVTRGRSRASRVNDPTRLEEYLKRLSEHDRVQGFSDPVGRRVLDRWVRAAIIRVGRMGLSRAKRREQIEYVLPLTLASYKTGFPAEIRRQRNVHVFLYELLLHALDRHQVSKANLRLSAVFEEAFGRGVTVGPGPSYDARYDGDTELDIHAMLSLAYLDGLSPTPVSKKERRNGVGPAIPDLASAIGTDLLRYLLAYRRLPTIALARGLQALINLMLLSYTVSLVRGVLHLVEHEELPPHWSPEREPLFYVDFTQERRGRSDELARACVERDLEDLGRFFRAALLLRTLDRFIEQKPTLQERLRPLETPDYLLELVRLRREPSMIARAEMEIEAIRYESLAACQSNDERDELREWFDAKLSQRNADAVSLAVDLLGRAQGKKATEAYVRWFWSVGGLRKPFGILSGNVSGRRNWRYAMSDDLLAALVHLALVEGPSERLEAVEVRSRLRLQDFLAFLESRFGILVDRPPDFLDGAAAREAAAHNLAALRRRLRLMGFFRALSDDFTAQYIEAQYIGVPVSKEAHA